MTVRSLVVVVVILATVPFAGANPAPLDLSHAANRGFRDGAAEDGKGGWTDQGGNDFRGMPTGERELCGVPFRILDPAGNGGRACVVLRGTPRPDLPESATMPVGRKAGALVFLHTLAWNEEATPVARYVIRYEDGDEVSVPIRSGTEVAPWWGVHESETRKVAVLSRNLACRQITLYAWQWRNPHPERAIREVLMRSTNSGGVPIVVAVTALDQPVALTSEIERPDPEGFHWLEAEDFDSYNVPAPPVKDEDGNLTGDFAYDWWPDPRFSGGHLMEMRPPINLKHPRRDVPEKYLRVIRDGVLKTSYTFEADRPDTYALWARVGPASVYSNFRWRVDDGEWTQITRQNRFHDMWEVAFWVTLGWVKLGTADLVPGEHVLHIEVPNPDPERWRDFVEGTSKNPMELLRDTPDGLEGIKLDADDGEVDGGEDGGGDGDGGQEDEGSKRWVLMVDCFVVTRIPFQPIGKLRPGEQLEQAPWLDDISRWHVVDLSEEALPKAGERRSWWLDGVWEMARHQEPIPSPNAHDEEALRSPQRSIPEAGVLRWFAVQVPHTDQGPETALLNRRWYRKYVSVPEDALSRSWVLHFSESNYTTSVFVNGELAGTHKGGYVPFAVDITPHLRPAELNEILVCVKGLAYYRREFRPQMPWGLGTGFHRQMLVPGRTGWHKRNMDGLAGSVRLESAGLVRAEFPFVQTDFGEQQLTASVEVVNGTAVEVRGRVRFEVLDPDAGDRRVITFVSEPFTLAAGERAAVSARGSGADLTPWWPRVPGTPEGMPGAGAPKLYTLRAVVEDADGTALDTLEDRFGYREVSIEDKAILVNGRRLNSRSVISGDGDTLGDVFAGWRRFHCNTLRLPHTGWNRFFKRDQQRATLDYADEQGIGVRFNSQINGMFIDLATGDPRFWRNATDYWRKVVKAYRNHPSILIWTAENELDLISNMAGHEGFKRREWAMMKTAHEVDPSRPVMGDGAGDLLGNCEICNWHYPEVGPIADPNDRGAVRERAEQGVGVYPRNAFTWQRLSHRNAIQRPWDRKRPLWIGETYFYSGKVSRQAWIGGDHAMSGRDAADEASAAFIDMLIRGYRWNDVAGINIFTGATRIPSESVRRAMAPLVVLSRDAHHHFRAGGVLDWRLKVFNDWLFDADVAFRWELLDGEEELASGRRDLHLPAGHSEAVELNVPLPQGVQKRVDARLVLGLEYDGVERFREAHPVSIFPPIRPPQPSDRRVVVVDPGGAVKGRLDAWGWEFAVVGDVPRKHPAPLLLVVGPDGLGGDPKLALRRILNLVADGARVCILEQSRPFPKGVLPLELRTRPAAGAYAWPRGSHPALEGVQRDDLQLWARGQEVFRRPFLRNPHWPILVDASAHEQLSLAPVVELPMGKGRLVLCQLLVGEKMADVPAAERLFASMLKYAGGREEQRPLTSVLPKGTSSTVVLETSRFQHRSMNLDEAEMAFIEPGVVLMEGNAASLKRVAGFADTVREWANEGNWLVLAGLDGRAVGPLGTLVDLPIIARPFRVERVTVEAREDPLMAGLGNHDVYWEESLTREEAEERRFLHGDRPIRGDVFSHVLVYDDIASLSGPHAVSNGLTARDHWKYILYTGRRIGLRFPRRFPVKRVEVLVNEHYKRMREIALTLNGNEDDRLRQEVRGGRAVFEFDERPVRRMHLEATEFTDLKGRGPFGWDLVRVIRTLPPRLAERMVPLTNPGGMVKFPMGEGGVVLCAVNRDEPKGKRVLMQLLHNLGVGRRADADQGGAGPAMPVPTPDGGGLDDLDIW